MSHRRMILAAGLQSGGTSLVSWCFLQRRDTNGVLDMPNDIIQTSFDKVTTPILWVKMTIGAFRWLELSETYRDLGWQVEPLLIIRDVRATFTSLMRKYYGFNGTTAEQPPLRLRFRRFLRDWELFRANDWPILKYEEFIRHDRRPLLELCTAMRLPWDEGMVRWSKTLPEIAYVHKVQKTFAATIDRGSLQNAKLLDRAEIGVDGLPLSELDWLEETFRAFNETHGYPTELPRQVRETAPAIMPPPRPNPTVREWFMADNDRLYGENKRLLEEVAELRGEVERARERADSTSAASREPAVSQGGWVRDPRGERPT
ncbi:MAG: hypothetical protein ACYC61_28675 [Isosphaeraceae bacterium]